MRLIYATTWQLLVYLFIQSRTTSLSLCTLTASITVLASSQFIRQSLWKNLLPKLNNTICQKDMPIPLQWTIWYRFFNITHPGMLTTLCLWNNYKTMWHLTPQGSSWKITSIHDKKSGPWTPLIIMTVICVIVVVAE